MAITDIKEFAHLTEADIEELGRELDTIRRDVEESLGARDARYIRRTVEFQRILEATGRIVLFRSRTRTSWWVGTGILAVAKSIENMELGHNVIHGQWDWMNEPEIHSTSWEWDMACPAPQWKHSHNFLHHKYTNVVGMDHDVGFGVMRVTRDQQWKPMHLLQPLQNLILAVTFEWGIAVHDIKIGRLRTGTEQEQQETRAQLRELARKVRRQVAKDYVFFPALSGRRFVRTLQANALANVLRNLWTYVVIFCGHFPDGAEKFTVEELEHETPAEWYLRQMLGTANIDAGPVMAFMTGNLSYQIEHHLFPDLPSNRYAEIAVRVRALCEKYDLPYTTGSLARQYLLTLRTIYKLALPNEMLSATADDAPETSSERKFRSAAGTGRTALREAIAVDPTTGRRRGLRTALREMRGR
ncbi:fatty acid desaturase [Rhodococcus sp. D2-41]|uniref:fatty acid desaturase family protein n=1 Tax=Speluncibacter jeojiensis TaxID=2710754 RepID=UPI00240F54CB|nr:fatty acid desaturase [Rhodococcus sp. D2-41]MDG3008783.1 fatty acid desaturase [Rhodococcus sp. D2-41]